MDGILVFMPMLRNQCWRHLGGVGGILVKLAEFWQSCRNFGKVAGILAKLSEFWQSWWGWFLIVFLGIVFPFSLILSQ